MHVIFTHLKVFCLSAFLVCAFFSWGGGTQGIYTGQSAAAFQLILNL